MESDHTKRRERRGYPGNDAKTALNRLCLLVEVWERRFNGASSVVTVIRFGTATYLKEDQYRDDGNC